MVIAIIGILAAVAIPYYQGHKIRAKLVEVENVMATLKSAASAYRQQRENWPDCPTINEIRNSLGIGLGNISRISEASIINGIITAKIQNIDSKVDGKILTLTPTTSSDGSFSWSWGWTPDFPPDLTPKTK